eukprot:6075162-Prymnesium_polylepis.1
MRAARLSRAAIAPGSRAEAEPPPAAAAAAVVVPVGRGGCWPLLLWGGSSPAYRARRGCFPAEMADYRAHEGDRPGGRLPPAALAQQSSVHRVRKLLSAAEIEQVLRLGERLAWVRPNPNGARQTCYLSAGRAFASSLPA